MLSSPEAPEIRLPAPSPPAIEPGAVEVHATDLTEDRERTVRRGIARIERRILSIYGDYLEKRHSHERGRLQLRLGIDGDGKVVESKAVHSEVDRELVERILEALADVDLGGGSEAWIFYSIQFEPDPLEVLALRPDFRSDTPALLAQVENGASFPVPRGRARVTVLSADGGDPRSLEPVELDHPFPARSRETIRIPVPREEATLRNTFLLDVEPRFR